ncbi:MAG: CRISPR-associated helicase Cas3' [Gemmatimonadaceae bacterium]
MKGAPTDFWGKLERDPATSNVTEWHPLIDHCADVAACAAAILRLSTWRRRLAHFCGREDLDEITCARLSVLAALHDIGKFNLGFQAKGRPELGTSAGHVREAIPAIGREVLAGVEQLGEWGPGTAGLLVSAICHHGRPYSIRNETGFEAYLWGARGANDPRHGVDRLMAATKVWFPLAFSTEVSELPENAGFEHAYAGLVMLADWAGSDTRLFPYSKPGERDRMHFASDAARQFLAHGWLDIDEVRRADGAEQNAFARVAKPGERPHPVQAAVFDLPSQDDWSITIVESETGSGKTEAALARFVTLFSAGAVDGMYFALPTRTAATEMHHRIFEAMQRAFTNPPPVVLAVPGYLRVDDVDGRKLPRFEVLWPDRDTDRFRYRAWAGEGAKRYLAGCIVVGTIDQVLLSSLRVRHAHLRATALLRQLLVVDEVHASDAYMTCILEDVLARHIRAGGHALLLSATLGGEARARLLRPGQHVPLPDFDEAVSTAYPLISHRGATELAVSVKDIGPPRVVSAEAEPWLEDAKAVAAAALEAARSGAKVLVVKNTVADCLETQRDLERIAKAGGASELLFSAAGEIAPHHSRFARSDREILDKALQERFGKERSQGGCVLVATQTVQQSLDLDADFLLTDLCPMDVLLQRIGRLHRHSRKRDSGFKMARAKIIVPANRDLGRLLDQQGRARHHHGLGTVYRDLRALQATWDIVEENRPWRIPEMNRKLVERSIHSVALDAVSNAKGGHWLAHSQQVLGTTRGENRQAELNLVAWTTPYSETSFSDDEHVPTRLGEGDRRVRFERMLESPFGCGFDELTVPGRWALAVPSTEETANSVSCVERVTRFQFDGKAFVYDRHGLRVDREQHDDSDDGP